MVFQVYYILIPLIPAMGILIRLTKGWPPQEPLETRPRCHSDQRCCTHLSKTICKRSKSCECQQADQLCTSGCLSENCYNRTKFPPIPRARRRIHNTSRPLTNGGKNTGGPTRPPWTSSESYLTQTTHYSPPMSQPTVRAGQTHRPAPSPTPRIKLPPRLPPPKAPHQ